MTMQLIPVYAEVDVARIAQDLRDEGIIVIVTNRVQVLTVVNQVSGILCVDEESEHYVSHLSFQVDDRGWEDCLMYSKVVEHDLRVLESMTIESVRAWVAAGEHKYYVHHYKYDA